VNRVVRESLVPAAAVAVVALVVGALGGPSAALVVVAVGAAAILAFHVWHLAKIEAWASGALDADVPEGRGAWAPVFAAIYRRMRVRSAYERDLRQVIERFQQASAAIPDGIVVLDSANRIDWANARALAQLGLDLKQDRGQPIANLVRQPEFHRYLETGDYGSSIIVASQRDPGRSLALQLVPFAAEQKLLMSRDVTELEAVGRMRRDFIANVSHELKTPLTVISGFVETLQDLDLDDTQRARFLALMGEQAANMQRLVADLLTLSSLESDENPLQEKWFDIVPLLLAVSSDAKALSKKRHRIALDIRDAARALGSRDELASAFGNLVSNAVRYTPADGSIGLAWRVEADGDGVFSVTDTGIGIPAENLPRLTERFYRVDRGRSRAMGGTGLGLAIVKHVLIRHQADLDITSERGRGSTFTVRLPAKRIERVGAPVPSDTDERGSPEVRATTSTAAPRETGA